MTPSRHFKKRVKGRVGIKKGNAQSFLDRAEKEGFTIRDAFPKQKLYRYLNSLITDETDDLILYNRYIIIYGKYTDVGITVLNLPKEYYAMEDYLKKKRLEELENERNTSYTNQSTSFG